MKLKFKDGVEIETSGRLRKLTLFDGVYVVGQGLCISVKDDQEADKIIQKLSTTKSNQDESI
jgi:hypothetical protein